MEKFTRNAAVFLVIAFTLAGCGKSAKEANDLFKQKIAVQNDMAAEYDKVSDKASMELAMQAIPAHIEKLKNIEEQINAMDPGTKEAAIAANQGEWDAAVIRVRDAKNNAKNRLRTKSQ